MERAREEQTATTSGSKRGRPASAESEEPPVEGSNHLQEDSDVAHGKPKRGRMKHPKLRLQPAKGRRGRPRKVPAGELPSGNDEDDNDDVSEESGDEDAQADRSDHGSMEDTEEEEEEVAEETKKEEVVKQRKVRQSRTGVWVNEMVPRSIEWGAPPEILTTSRRQGLPVVHYKDSHRNK